MKLFRLPVSSRRGLCLVVAITALVLATAVGSWRWSRAVAPAAAAVTPPPAPAVGVAAFVGPPEDEHATGALRQWIAEYRAEAAPGANRAALVRTGAELIERRRARMQWLIRHDPRRALAEALRFDEYLALPEALRARVERPYSVRADHVRWPDCTGERAAPDERSVGRTTLFLPEGTSAAAFGYGRRAALLSKRQVPVHGVLQDGETALAETVFRELAEEELTVGAALFPAGQADFSRSFATGQPLAGAGLRAVAGGRLYAFADRAELQQLEAGLAALDDRPGPTNGSSLLFAPAGRADPSAGFDLAGAEALAGELASQWSESRKRVFLIRVDFADTPGEPVTQAAATDVVNGPTSEAIRAMSYNKTWIDGAVSAAVYRLPQSAAYYADRSNPDFDSGSFSGRNAELLRDARNTFRTARSGADAAIDIGPTDTNGTGSGGGLGDYDIVGVFFGAISLRSGGVQYAGLASVGGADLWVQAANYPALYVHELGHNYGLGHASFWRTTDGSVTGTGESVEYGDPFDVMGSGPADRGHFHPQGKARLNWLDATQWVDATAAGGGRYRVFRIDDGGTTGALRGLRVTKAAAAGAQEYYWIGYRPAYAERPALANGACLLWQRPASDRRWLLDTTPGSPDGALDAGLVLGRTYSDPAAAVHITPVATGGTGAERYLDVQVNLGAFPGNRAPVCGTPTGPATVAARTAAAYTAPATDADGDTLSYWWNGADGTVGANAPALVRSWTVGGTYTLAVTASDMKGGVATASRQVVVTDPLDTWSTAAVAGADDLLALVPGAGRFVAADYWGRLFLSWDGAAWAAVGSVPDFEREPALAHGSAGFVLAGKRTGAAAGQLAYSKDGRRWQLGTFPAGMPQLRAVAYGGGQYVAVGDDGTALRSADGATWTAATVADLPDFRHLVWDGTGWVAAALDPGAGWPRRLWTSPDGAVWTRREALDSDLFGLFAHEGTVYAMGWYAGLLYSTDHGATWQPAALPGTTAWSTYRMAAAPDGTLVLTGAAMSESGAPRALLVSTDGRTWSRVAGQEAVANANDLVFGAGRFVAVANAAAVHASATFYPGNRAPVAAIDTLPSGSVVRQPAYFAGSATDADGDALTYVWDFGAETPMAEGRAIAPVFSFGGTYGLTLRVTDGRGGLATVTGSVTLTDPVRTWTQRTSGVSANLNAVAANASLVVAVGDNGTVVTSSDGAAWTVRSLPDWGGNLYLQGVTWDGARFIAVGKDYDWDIPAWVGVIYSSGDGVTWNRRYKGGAGGTDLLTVASSGPVAVAAGIGGSVLRSVDTVTWTSVAVPDLGATAVGGVAWGGGTFALLGSGSGAAKVFTSGDGQSWVDRSTGTGLADWQYFERVAWLRDRFVASGWYSRLRVSTDAGTTFTPGRAKAERLPALAAGGGVFFTAGVDLEASNAAVDVLSLDGTTWFSLPAPTAERRNAAAYFRDSFITVGDGGAIWQSGVVSSAAGWAAWQAAQFPAGGLEALPDRDPDGDGLSNRLEYALGRDPLVGVGSDGSAALPQSTMATGRFGLRLDLPAPAPADATYFVQGTADLAAGAWTTLARKEGAAAWQWLAAGSAQVEVGAAANGRVVIVVGRPDSAAALPRYFMRLAVEVP